MTKRMLFVEELNGQWVRASNMEVPTFREMLGIATGLGSGDSLLRMVRMYRKLGEPFGRLDFGRLSF